MFDTLYEMPDERFTKEQLRSMHVISSEDPEMSAYFGFPAVQKLILMERVVADEFAEKRNAAVQKQELLDNTYYATGGGNVVQRRALFDGSLAPAPVAESATIEVASVSDADTLPQAVALNGVRALRAQELVNVGDNL